MIVMVSGSRDWTNVSLVQQRLRRLPRGTIIRHGGARGLDRIVDTVGKALGFDVREYPADWNGLGRSAGAQRTIAMLQDYPSPDLALCWWLDGSRGTFLAIETAKKLGIPFEVVTAFTYPVTLYDPSPSMHSILHAA